MLINYYEPLAGEALALGNVCAQFFAERTGINSETKVYLDIIVAIIKDIYYYLIENSSYLFICIFSDLLV